ncbi:hypothetical protein BaOVIS_002220 [Babesia ovis]|uniref:Uncharacterized protein n=1 Tax=Babesia ovis TaxID=5869 RepID=A0A9W5T9T8_BABOV|nr:hypothetical protein BaOVIS_002220 [Babesia ovis]
MDSGRTRRRQTKFWMIIGASFCLVAVLIAIIVTLALTSSEPSETKTYQLTVFNENGDKKVLKVKPEDFYKSLEANLEFMATPECLKDDLMRDRFGQIFVQLLDIAKSDGNSWTAQFVDQGMNDGDLAEDKSWMVDRFARLLIQTRAKPSDELPRPKVDVKTPTAVNKTPASPGNVGTSATEQNTAPSEIASVTPAAPASPPATIKLVQTPGPERQVAARCTATDKSAGVVRPVTTNPAAIENPLPIVCPNEPAAADSAAASEEPSIKAGKTLTPAPRLQVDADATDANGMPSATDENGSESLRGAAKPDTQVEPEKQTTQKAEDESSSTSSLEFV